MTETERAADALHHLNAHCSRDEWVRVGMAAKSAGLLFDDFHNWSATAGNYLSENDCRIVWNSFDESGAVTRATLFAMAIAQGWKDPSKSRSTRRKKSCPSLTPPKPEQPAQMPVKQAVTGNVTQVWEQCIPATPAEPYIHRKQGKPDGLRVYPASAPPLIIRKQNVAGYLVVPCWNGDELQTLQFIPPGKGDKLNLPGASFNDGFFTVGEITDRAYIVEGIGQAWAVNRTTGAAAAVCFGAGRMETVAKVLRAQNPAARLVLLPDRGKEADAEKIAGLIGGQWVEMPADKPSNYDANDYLQEAGASALATLLEHVKAPAMRYKLLSGADLCNAPPMRWIVHGVFPMQGLGALFGASGSGKSFLILDMAFAVAGGDAEWFCRRLTQAPVTYVCLEGETGIGKRVQAWRQHQNKPVPDALRFVTQPFDLRSDDVPQLAKAIIASSGTGGLVIIDTLNRAAPGADENSSVDMGSLIAAAKQLQSLIGGLVLLVHHTGKDEAKGLRGHSSLYAALDGAIEVKAGTRRKWSVAKSKDDVTGDEYSFELEIVPIASDDEGEEITSCVVVPDDSGKAIQRKELSLGSNQIIAHEMLAQLLSKSQHFGMNGAPADRPCINYDEAVVPVAKRMPTDAKHKKLRAKQAIKGLVDNGILGMKGDWLWNK